MRNTKVFGYKREIFSIVGSSAFNLNKIRQRDFCRIFDWASQISTEVQPLSFVPNRIFKSCLIYYKPTIPNFFPSLQKLAHDSTSKMVDLLI